MKVLCIGHSSWDITVPADSYPTENTKYRFNEKVAAGGGPAGNAAYLLGKWGVDTVIATVVGSDDFGTRIKKEFQSVGVNTDYIETSYDKDTSLSFILINKNNGNRTVFNVSDHRPALKKNSYDFTPDIILSDGNDYAATQNAINAFPEALSVIDAGRVTDELLELCKYMKYIVCSKGFAETVTGSKFDFENPNSLVDIYMKLQNKYPYANLVITLEEHGCLYKNGNEVKIMNGVKIEAKDTTGAGDIFHGAFVYGLASRWDIEKIVMFANIAAGISVGKVGSRFSIPTLSEVMDYYTQRTGVTYTEEEVEQAKQVEIKPQGYVTQNDEDNSPIFAENEANNNEQNPQA